MTAAPESADDILDSLFHGCAWAAYFDQMAEEGRFPPDSEATRRRAYAYYEEELRKKNVAKAAPPPTPPAASR